MSDLFMRLMGFMAISFPMAEPLTQEGCRGQTIGWLSLELPVLIE